MQLDDYELVMIHLVRDVELLEQAKLAGLEPADFQVSKLKHYRFIWQATSEYFDNHRELIPQMILEREVGELLANEEMVTERLSKRVWSLVKVIYGVEEEDLASDYVRETLLQQMVDDLKIAPRLKEMGSETDSSRIKKLFHENQQLYDRTRVIVNQPADLFSPEGRQRHTENSQPEETGIDFIDKAIHGVRPSSFVGLLAESAGGKTMMGTQFLCEQAMNDCKALGFFYEQSLEGDIAERFYSYLANAPRTELWKKTHNEYPEHVRKHLDAIQARLQRNMQIYDMSGAVKGQGNGGPDEIELILERLHRRGEAPKYIVIDWLSPLVIRYFNMPKNVVLADKREKIDLVVDRFKGIAGRYRVTIVLLHQIAPHIIEAKTPHYKPDWTVAAECKSFGWLMDYVFTFGRKCKETNCMWFNVPKARGAPTASRIVRMDGELNKIHDAHDYTINPMPDRDKIYFTKKGKRERALPPAGSV